MKEMIGGCCVCSDEQGWADNPLVYCDGKGCNVAVHQACYGIEVVPSGSWYCKKCEYKGDKFKVVCKLCPNPDGALKRTDTKEWAHVICALYIPEVEFGDVKTMEPIIISKIPKERYNKVCYICENKETTNDRKIVGACMACHKFECPNDFHVTCGQKAGLLCEKRSTKAKEANIIKYTGFCSFHYKKEFKPSQFLSVPAYIPPPIKEIEMPGHIRKSSVLDTLPSLSYPISSSKISSDASNKEIKSIPRDSPASYSGVSDKRASIDVKSTISSINSVTNNAAIKREPSISTNTGRLKPQATLSPIGTSSGSSKTENELFFKKYEKFFPIDPLSPLTKSPSYLSAQTTAQSVSSITNLTTTAFSFATNEPSHYVSSSLNLTSTTSLPSSGLITSSSDGGPNVNVKAAEQSWSLSKFILMTGSVSAPSSQLSPTFSASVAMNTSTSLPQATTLLSSNQENIMANNTNNFRQQPIRDNAHKPAPTGLKDIDSKPLLIKKASPNSSTTIEPRKLKSGSKDIDTKYDSFSTATLPKFSTKTGKANLSIGGTDTTAMNDNHYHPSTPTHATEKSSMKLEEYPKPKKRKEFKPSNETHLRSSAAANVKNNLPIGKKDISYATSSGSIKKNTVEVTYTRCFNDETASLLMLNKNLIGDESSKRRNMKSQLCGTSSVKEAPNKILSAMHHTVDSLADDDRMEVDTATANLNDEIDRALAASTGPIFMGGFEMSAGPVDPRLNTYHDKDDVGNTQASTEVDGDFITPPTELDLEYVDNFMSSTRMKELFDTLLPPTFLNDLNRYRAMKSEQVRMQTHLKNISMEFSILKALYNSLL